MRFLMIPFLWAAGRLNVPCFAQQDLPEVVVDYDELKQTGRAEAAKILREFEAESHVAMVMAERTEVAVPGVIVGEAGCPLGGFLEPSATADVQLPLLTSLIGKSPDVVSVDETGRAHASCPAAIISVAPFYGQKGASFSSFQLISAPSATLNDLKQMVDMTRLGLDKSFNQYAYGALQICNDFFFSGTDKGTALNSSDTACVVGHLDDSSPSIQALDTERLRKLHPRIRTALHMASIFASTPQKREWIKKLLSSKSLRFGWHIVETFSEMNVSMLQANVGEAINEIVLKEPNLRKPFRDLIQFGIFF